ncbi:S8 family serine peptidase [Actinoallomurus sp. NBC_01490]|uniref:S8 family serine peptidase n=1 Tax=Actinoallomurus sp. NBC_01490 TaxID=2903557 RepID=UPI002E2FF465|nr:S8 family serine peptidase [Actinoallomurus sp. NBC_01490]
MHYLETAPEVNVERAPGATGSVRISTVGRDTKATATPATGTGLPGAETTMSLPVIHGEAVRTRRSKADAFWSALTGRARHDRTPSANKTSGTSGASAASPFTAGVDKVWLDGRAKTDLADTTAQIGAPAAWSAGGTGAGVRVAVLDSGADTAHPDLADRIVSSKSFVPGEDVIDRLGHGTHTASTVAGTGAASHGEERGVAPEADLLVGKVLSNKGMGQDSWVIAGMEWAARTEHAKVINMSLGDPSRHGQNDPVSQALNQLSAETGALFVVSAGNDGHGSSYHLGAPGTADAALTVGAVDRSDNLAEFSSAGPRLFDDGLKPDITAPGVGVVAARSQYMATGTGYYVGLDGTSMAAPHVSGAAVLLAQKHPEWSGQQIKNALMSSSALTSDHNPYEAGTGRVSASGAYFAHVVATGSVDAGLVSWPRSTPPQPIKREITYTNVSDATVALDLSVDPNGSAGGVFTLGADHLTVPARGTAQVDLTVDPKGLDAGQYTAQVLAKDGGGAAVAHTAAGVSVEAEKRNLTVHMEDRSGRPMSGAVHVAGDNGVESWLWLPEDGTLTSRWAPGTYVLSSFADVEGVHGSHSLGEAVLVAPEVDLTTDRDVDLDASRARRVKVATPKPTAVVESRLDVWRSFTSSKPEPGTGAIFDVLFPSADYDSVWALPTKDEVTKGSFAFGTRFRAEQTPLAITYEGNRLDGALAQPGSRPLPDGTSRLDAVFAGNGTAADYAGLAARGKAVVVRSADAVPTDQAAAEAAGAAMLIVVDQESGRISDWWYGRPDHTTAGSVPVASVSRDEGEELIKKLTAADQRPVQLAVEAHPTPKYLYDLADYHVGRVPADPSAKTDLRSLARVDLDFAVPSGKRGLEKREDFPPYQWPGDPALQWGNAVTLPFANEPVAAGTRTDWISAGTGVQWRQSGTLRYANSQSGAVQALTTRADTMSYEAGSTHEDRWFGPIIRPRLIANNALYRYADGAFGMTVDGLGDAGSAHAGPAYETLSLYQGATQIFQIPYYYYFYWSGLDKRELPYRLVVDTTGQPDLSPYSTSTSTEWRFTSGATTEMREIPLVQLDYAMDLDLAGRAERRTGVSVTPSVLGGTSANDTVSAVGLDVSYDDGSTWQPQDLKEKRGTWRASLNAPAGASYVSIRVTAKQRNGGGVTQTVIRAFGLKP